MKQITIDTPAHPLYRHAMQLYRSAFPAQERRSDSYHALTLGRAGFHPDALTDDDGSLAAIFYWWHFADLHLRYVEHFAVSPHRRGQGAGSHILARFLQASQGELVLLEVEPPHQGEWPRRRIEFYRRAGFHLSDAPYRQPSYTPGGPPVELGIMSAPRIIEPAELHAFVEECHPRVHFLSDSQGNRRLV